VTAPPRWDLSSFFPGFDSPEHEAFEGALGADAAALLVDAALLALPDGVTEAAWAAAIVRYEDLQARFGHLASYVVCLASADAEDERYQQAEGRLSVLRATVEKIASEIRRGLGSCTEAAFRSLAARAELRGAGFFLERCREESRHRMSSELEGLASDLATHGISGWGRLYDTLSGRLSFEMTFPGGKTEVVPMAQRRSLMADADRRVRREAFEKGNVVWEKTSEVTTAAINHIAGTRHLLNARRGVGHFLDVAVFESAVSRKTLSAMMEAVRDGAPLARKGLLLKARAMGLPAISWWDLEAPLPLPEVERIPYDEGVRMVERAIGRAYPSFRSFFERALAKGWVEAEPRAKKRPGAYCTGSDVTNEPRVFMTYQGSLGDLSTLAHEMGHAFHWVVICERRVLARVPPMTLAETASTFAENLLSEGLLADPTASPTQRALVLGEIAGDAAAFLLDVPARFWFEEKVYEERKRGELATSRLCALMRETHREVFGEALVPGDEDPWFWASKHHFFIPDLSFYNFPYTFGFLLARALVGLLQTEGPAFLPKYEEFLKAAGSGRAHEVARATIGRDMETPEFWRDAIETLRAPIDELERLLPSVMPSRAGV